MKVSFWRGDDWKDEWDSSRSDQRHKLPHMVQIEIVAWDDPTEEIEQEDTDAPTSAIRTMVYLTQAYGRPEQKEPLKTPKWF